MTKWNKRGVAAKQKSNGSQTLYTASSFTGPSAGRTGGSQTKQQYVISNGKTSVARDWTTEEMLDYVNELEQLHAKSDPIFAMVMKERHKEENPEQWKARTLAEIQARKSCQGMGDSKAESESDASSDVGSRSDSEDEEDSMTKSNKPARGPKANAPKAKPVSPGAQSRPDGPKIEYIDSFDEVNCVGPYIVKMDGSQPTAEKLKLNGTIYILRNEPSDEAMLDYVDKLEAAQAKNNPGYAAYLARRDAKESPAERRKRELAQMEASKAVGDSKTVEFNPMLADSDSDDEEESGGMNDTRNLVEETLRSGPDGTMPAIIIDGTCYVFKIELDEAKIQELTGAFMDFRTKQNSLNCDKRKVEEAKTEALKLLNPIAEAIDNIAEFLGESGEKKMVFAVARIPVHLHNESFLTHLAERRKMFEEKLRSGLEGSKPAIVIDGKCYVINVELDDSKIQELTGAFMDLYATPPFKKEKFENSKRKALQLISSIAEEDHEIAKLMAVVTKPEEKDSAFWVFRTPGHNEENYCLPGFAPLETLLYTELTSGRGSGTIPGVIIDDGMYFVRAEPTDDNVKELAKAMAKFIGARQVPDYPRTETPENLRQSVLDKLVPIDGETWRSMELEKGDRGQRFDTDETGEYPIIVFRCRMKKEINGMLGNLAIDVVESKEESKVNSGNFAIDLAEPCKDSSKNEEYEEVGSFNPHDVKCKCVIS